jgi:2-C-methyl-D-erythritol 2,4-cyclodiphosphate synthase
MRAGLSALPSGIELVAVHDAARCLVSATDLRALVAAARESGAALLGERSRDTIKRVVDGRVVETPDRSGCWAAQTPQVIRRDWLEEAMAAATQAGRLGTDDAQLVEWLGRPVAMVEATAPNPKITRPEDLRLAEVLLSAGEAGAGGGGVRIGQGYDVHQLVPGRRLVLGGVDVPHDRGLEGHSDGDALLHAVADAILGALGAGDLGRHFPSSDDRWRGADSREILAAVVERMRAAGYRVGNVDATIVAQAPRLAPHQAAMHETLARSLGTEPARVNIKVTSTDRLGAIGREEGIAGMAVVLLEREDAAGGGVTGSAADGD